MKKRWLLSIVFTLASVACGDNQGTSVNPGTGGSGGKPATGGTLTGGTVATGGVASGGSPASGGTTAAGGTVTSGGTTTSTTGGSPSSGGTTTTAKGGTTSGGAPGSGGIASSGGSGPTTGGTTGGTTMGGGTSAGGNTGGGGSSGGGGTTAGTDEGIMGFATQGSGGTTGGGNETPVVVKSMAELNSAASGTSPKVIHVSGAFSGQLKPGSNKTIIGLPGAKITNASLTGSNIIIRNISFTGGTDTIVTNGAHHVWLDHLSLQDGADGVLDITHGSDFFTISWTKIWYTRTSAHRFASLVGNRDDTGSEDRGKLHTTFYKVWWADKVDQRQPRVRYGQVHVLNNLYTSTGNTYAIAPGVYSNILAEKNIFIDITEALHASFYNSTPDAVLENVGNVFKGTTTGREGKKGTVPVFTPPYPYTASEPDDAMEASIRAGAGPTLKF